MTGLPRVSARPDGCGSGRPHQCRTVLSRREMKATQELYEMNQSLPSTQRRGGCRVARAINGENRTFSF